MRCYARATIHDSSQRGLRERCTNGRTLTPVFKAENQGVPFVSGLAWLDQYDMSRLLRKFE